MDERSAALIMMKCLPLGQLIQSLYPDMYKVDSLELAKTKEDEEGQLIPAPDRLQLSAEHVTLNGAFLMDCGDKMLLFLGKVLQPFFCEKVICVFLYFVLPNKIFEIDFIKDVWSEQTFGCG